MAGLVLAIYVFPFRSQRLRRGCPLASEATPFFERLSAGMTEIKTPPPRE